MHRSKRSKGELQSIFFIFAAMVMLVLNFQLCYGASELYMAGIPDEEPLEYYNKKSETYDGILPELLGEVCEEAGITLRYINPSSEDERLNLAANIQVDAICTYGLSEEELEQAGLEKGIELFTYDEEGETVSISLAYTKSVSDEVRYGLEKEIANLDPSHLQGIMIRYALESSSENDLTFVYKRVLPVLLGVALIFLVILPFYLFKQKRQIEENAYMDEITGWENFYGWKRRYEKIIVDGNRQHYAVLYMYAGIDQVSHIYGYPEAENALCLITEICKGQIDREHESFSRFNEYFFAFFVQYTSVEELRRRVELLQERVEQGFKDGKKKYFLDMHTGIYRLTDIDTEPVKALQFSDVAMEYARMNYLPCAFYNEYVERETIVGYAMEHEAIHGLMHKEFLMYLQPIIDLKTGEISGAEALVRWNNPNRGLLRPNEFLDVMRKKQLTGRMNMEIFKQGCAFLSRELERGNRLCILFNFTVENIQESRFPEQLYAVTQQYGVAVDQIMIQLNQLVEISSAEGFIDTVQKLVEYGFEVCLAGLELDRVFLQYLECGVKTVKIRQELVQKLHMPECRKIVESIAVLCHDLGMDILAVGVENEFQAQALQELGCEFVSGFYYHYPVNQKNFEKLVSGEIEEN